MSTNAQPLADAPLETLKPREQKHYLTTTTIQSKRCEKHDTRKLSSNQSFPRSPFRFPLPRVSTLTNSATVRRLLTLNHHTRGTNHHTTTRAPKGDGDLASSNERNRDGSVFAVRAGRTHKTTCATTCVVSNPIQSNPFASEN